jgi:hypothetical protein
VEIEEKCGSRATYLQYYFFYLHNSINSDIFYSGTQGTEAALPMIIINFAHPLTDAQLQEIQALVEVKITTVLEISNQINPEAPLAPQIEKMLDKTGFNPQEWQTNTLLINLPSLNYSAAAVLAQLHGRMGYFPPVLRLRPLTKEIPLRYAVTEILNLQAMREQAREKR